MKVKQFYFEVRYWADGHTQYENVGKDASEAEVKSLVLQRRMELKAEAPNANLVVVDGPERKTLKSTAAACVKPKEDSSQFREAAAQARVVTREYLDRTKKRFVDELSTADITRFQDAPCASVAVCPAPSPTSTPG